MNLVWGATAYLYSKTSSTDETIADIEEVLKANGHVKSGDLFIVMASMPIKEKGRTNTIKINVVK
jgi:pyruvate kinase